MRTVYTAILSVGGFVIIMACIFFIIRRRRERKRRENQNRTCVENNCYPETPPQVYILPKGQSRIQNQGDMFAVPFDLLPTTFNYNAPGVIVKFDHVLIKDLSLIQVNQNPINDEYQKQAAYNPTYANVQ